jgi:hypothetical protein
MAEIPDLASTLLSDDASQIGGSEPAVETPDLRSGLTEDGVVGCDREVTDHMEHMPAPDRITGHEGNHRLRHAPDVALKFEDIQPGKAIPANITRLSTNPLVSSGAEGILTVLRWSIPREEDNSNRGILSRIADGLLEFLLSLGAEGIPHLWPIEGAPRHPIALVIGDVLISSDFDPLGVFHGFRHWRSRLM